MEEYLNVVKTRELLPLGGLQYNTSSSNEHHDGHNNSCCSKIQDMNLCFA
jgi:hypothetical protein